MALSNVSVFPTCEQDITTTSLIDGSAQASIISFWNCALLVSNLPASLLPSGDKTLNLSAHLLIVRVGGGLNRFRLDLTTSDIPFVIFGKVCSCNLVESVIYFIL